MIMFILRKYLHYQVYQLCKVRQLNLSDKCGNLIFIKGAIVAKAQGFDCQDSNVSGPDIFHKLIPMVTQSIVFK